MNTRLLVMCAALSLAVFGCADEGANGGSGGTPDAGGADGSMDTGGGLDAGDGSGDAGGSGDAPDVDDRTYFEGEQYMLEDSHVNVIRQFEITGLVEDGIANGFDIDQQVTEPGDPMHCNHGDLVDPDGREGIDNQLASIWSSLEPLIGEQTRALLQGAINEGRVLIMVELVGVDDLQNDDSVSLNVFRGLLDPDIGNKGLIAPDQTFYLDYDNPISSFDDVQIVDGEVIAGPFELLLPLQILELDIVANVTNAWLRFDIHDDGTFHGVIGGAFDLPQMFDAITMTGAEAEAELVRPIFESNADLGFSGGECTQLSAAFGIEGTTGFVVRDAALEE